MSEKFEFIPKKSRWRIFGILAGIINRCENPEHLTYYRYGGRGIRNEFKSQEEFVIWAINNGYADNLEIDRIDNDKNYSPGNCRWVTKSENGRNKSDSVFISYKNVKYHLKTFKEQFLPHFSYSHVHNLVYNKQFSAENLIEEHDNFWKVRYKIICVKPAEQCLNLEAELFKTEYSNIFNRIDEGNPKYLSRKKSNKLRLTKIENGIECDRIYIKRDVLVYCLKEK